MPCHTFGIAGWSYPDWKGCVYPPGCRDPLGYVAPYVDFIEINTSFYAIPAPSLAAGWLKRTQHLPNFFFTAKLNQDFTHGGRRDDARAAAFHEALRPLTEAGRLRALLAQFPASFDDTSEHAARLDWIAGAFRHVPLIVELRHASWQSPAALAFLQRLGVSVANLDYPHSNASFDLDTCRVGPLRYLRLHGRNAEAWANPVADRDQTYNYLYSPDELKTIASRIRTLGEGAREVMTAANNHYEGKELANAIELKAQVLRRPVPVPPLLKTRYPRLGQVEKLLYIAS